MNGCSPKLADLLASRSFPGTRGTDRAFLQGRALDGSQFEGSPDIVGRAHVKRAEAAGVNPTGKWYSGPLARYPGDPEAWVDSLSDVRRIAERRNLNVQGAVNVVAPEVSRTPLSGESYRVADDIVERHVADRLEDQPDLGPVEQADLRDSLSRSLSGLPR